METIYKPSSPLTEQIKRESNDIENGPGYFQSLANKSIIKAPGKNERFDRSKSSCDCFTVDRFHHRWPAIHRKTE
jgi:hypothetical protein